MAQGALDPTAQHWIAFDNPGSLEPFVRYRIFDVAAPVIGPGTTPIVASYLQLNGSMDGGNNGANLDPNNGLPILQVALVTRKVGLDAANPTGFTPEIIVIEGERFGVKNSADDFAFVISAERFSETPGLADFWANSFLERGLYKHSGPFDSHKNFQSFQPRPSMNEQGEVAFLGRIGLVYPGGGAPVAPAVAAGFDQAYPGFGEAFLKDEAVWTNRASSTGELEIIAREGDSAPVRVNGLPILNARFAPLGRSALSGAAPDTLTFFRPLINKKGQIVFLASWIDDGGTPSNPADDAFGRSVFLSRQQGHLECLVSSGDLSGTVFNVSEPPGGTTKARFSAEFGRVPNPSGDFHFFNSHGLLEALGQLAWTECGILAFTVRMDRADVSQAQAPAHMGWGLFVYNTAEPKDSMAVGPQFVAKTTSGDERLEVPDAGLIPVRDALMYHQGLSVGFGEATGGDAALHLDGSIAFAINPDDVALPVVATPLRATLDRDGDGVFDGCDDCPLDPSRFIGPCGGGSGPCTDCLLCLAEEDCPFEGLLLGAGPDFDQSGLVDDTDVTLMLRAMGNPGGRCDLDKDGMVGEKDLALLMDQYGKAVTKEADGPK